METSRVDSYFVANAGCFPADKLPLLRQKLLAVDDSRYEIILAVELKKPTTMLLIGIFLGGLGVDRFMYGEAGMGILKLLTGGLCGILWLIDCIKSMDKAKKYNFDKLNVVL